MYQVTLQAQFIKKLSNSEAELKKRVAYKEKRVVYLKIGLFQASKVLQPICGRPSNKFDSLN